MKNNKEEIKLTRKESNYWQLKNSSNPDYHFEKTDNFFGIKYDAKLVKSKNGKIYLKTKTRYGGLFYSGSLFMFIFTAVMSILLFINGISNIVNKEIGAGILQLIVMFFPLFFSIYSFRDFIEEFNEKKEYKKSIKEGKVQKEKLHFGAILYRILFFSFILFFVFMALGLFLSTNFDIDIMQIFYKPNV